MSDTDDDDEWHDQMLQKVQDMHDRADKLHASRGPSKKPEKGPTNYKQELQREATKVSSEVHSEFDELKDKTRETVKFLKAVHLGEINTDNVEERAPHWMFWEGEKSCLSGVCIELPCFDAYAPNLSGCCCCKPRYREEFYEFKQFFEVIMPQLHTGDVVLCAWPTEDGLRASKFITHSKWSHVGFIYRPSDFPQVLKMKDQDHPDKLHHSRPMVAQMLCSEDEEHPSAFYLNDFELTMKDYLDKFSNCDNPEEKSPFLVGVRFLRYTRDRAFYESIEATIKRYANVKYNMDTMSGIDLCQCWPCCKCNQAKVETDAMFCSEFVAQAFMDAGLINPNLNAAEFIPSMFDTTRHVWLRKGAFLSEEHVVVGPNELADRDTMGYKGQPGYLAGERDGDGIWGTDLTKAIEDSHVIIGTWPQGKAQMAPPKQTEMRTPLLRE